MNFKINTMCFIILVFLLVGVAAASDADNETLQKTIKQPDDDLCHISLDSQDELKASTGSVEKVKSPKLNPDKLEKSTKNTPIPLQAGKSKMSLTASKSTDSKTNVILKVANMKVHYNDKSKLTITLKNKNNKAIKNAKLKVTVFLKTYTLTTNSKGKAYLNINLEPGTHEVITKYEGSKKYNIKSTKSTITVKSSLKTKWPTTKYYTDKTAYYTTFYDKNGKLLKNTAVKVDVDSVSYSLKTNKNGVAKLSLDLKPGNHVITANNPKTGESKSGIVTVKSIIESNDLTITEGKVGKFSVKVLNGKGNAAANKRVILNLDGVTYTATSDFNGIASQEINLTAGNYLITTEYDGIKNTNQITVNKQPTPVKKSDILHGTIIPDYVNVTIPYENCSNETVKMQKIELITVETKDQTVKFTTGKSDIRSDFLLDKTSYFIYTDKVAIMNSPNKDTLKGTGILISKTSAGTLIEYQESAYNKAEFEVYAKSGAENTETFIYMENNVQKAKVSVQTLYYDETNVKNTLARLYQINCNDFNYNTITKSQIVFTDSGNNVTYSADGKSITGRPTTENIVTKFSDGKKEEIKSEEITYGHGNQHFPPSNFDVHQTYTLNSELS